MEPMSISESLGFRLSPKALRLYDEMGLLPPSRVDAATGYRSYGADQPARLTTALRQLGMTLAEITVVIDLDPEIATERVADYWSGAETEYAARRDRADFVGDRRRLFRPDCGSSGNRPMSSR